MRDDAKLPPVPYDPALLAGMELMRQTFEPVPLRADTIVWSRQHVDGVIPLDPAVYFIDHLPVATEPSDVITVIVASIAIAAVATIYPALQASRLMPIQAIRNE